MLSERITALFSLLQCSNTEIARYAGCSPGNISKLKTGNREPKPTSRSILALAEGVYGYADYENLLPVLAELCHAPDTGRDSLIPALIGWLFETEEVSLPRSTVTPKSRQTRARRRRSFGERLDRAMTLLSLSNGQLAALLNIDVSLVSRYRCGVYSPHGNEQLAERLSAVLAERAGKTGKAKTLAGLCGSEEAGPGAVAAWLFDVPPEEDMAAVARQLLQSLDDLGPGLPAEAPALPDIPIASRYVGTEGLRTAVLRFLSDAAREGGELLLYSDEPMDWMSGDPAYFALWASLMARCVSGGVRIRIIHNLDRGGEEMVDAIKGWFPLYISGRIEPYVFRREHNPRFRHTVFLRPGGACILGFYPAGAGSDRSYDYITDSPYLDRLRREYDVMLSAAAPFLKIYTAAMGEAFHRDRCSVPGKREYLLNELPVFTMPEALLTRMLASRRVSEQQKETALTRYRALRGQFEEALAEGGVHMILCLPEEAGGQDRQLNFALSLTELAVGYTQREYAEHLAAVIGLVERERKFHLTLLPHAPFQDIQIITRKDAVAALRCREPYAAFVFLNATLRQSVSAYLTALIDQHAEDRRTVAERLRALAGAEQGEIREKPKRAFVCDDTSNQE